MTEDDSASTKGPSRMEASEALRESEERFRTIVEMAPDGIFIADRTGRFVAVNESACKQLGYTREQLLQRKVYDIVPSRLADRITARLETLQDGVGSYESCHLRADGTEVPVELSICRVNLGGQPGFLGIARDITDRKHAEEQRAKIEDQLRQAQKMESIGRLAGGVAHDFNNLLTLINGYSDLMLSRLNQGDPLRNPLAQIRKAGGRAAELTQQLLAFSRKQIVEPKPVDLNRLISETQDLLRRLVGEDVELAARLAPSLGQVLADEGQLHQVLLNLAVNAREAMPGGGRLSIETANVELDQQYAAQQPEVLPGPYVLLAVSDTGVGMDEATRSRVFEPFFTTKTEGQGTGLGLSTVYGVVRQCNGWISVYSEPGHGTTFRIYLPRMDFLPPHEETATPAPAVLRGSETILVVEDQEEVRQLAVEVLKSYGYRVLEAAQGGDALLAVERHAGPIHLMLTDVVMPRMTGKELAERVSPLRPEMRVLFMSGYTDDVIAHQGVLNPGVAYISKPFAPHALAARVREILGPPLPVARILIVDDEEGIRSLFQQVLDGAGYEVLTANNGSQALKMIEQYAFDLVVTDLVMPEREGIETIQAIRKEHPALKIIAVSGAFGGSFLKTAQVLGANATLSKPVSPSELLATVRKVL